ncbi:MAG: hypothetical protein ACRCVJ_00775 [Clostridium sp.]|uniref:hypothetical protein n=1 Tax=Clostridium sp. TaxID=1506 RepID=UPI003F359951
MRGKTTEALELAVKLYFETGDLQFSLSKVEEMYKEKDLSATDQSKQIELNKNFNDIISSEEDIDNGEVYDKITDKTIRDL